MPAKLGRNMIGKPGWSWKESIQKIKTHYNYGQRCICRGQAYTPPKGPR